MDCPYRLMIGNQVFCSEEKNKEKQCSDMNCPNRLKNWKLYK